MIPTIQYVPGRALTIPGAGLSFCLTLYLLKPELDKICKLSPRLFILTASIMVMLILGIIWYHFPVSDADEAKVFHVAPIVALESDSNNSMGWYAVFDDNKSGYNTVFLTLLMQIKLINMQNFASRIDTLFMYQGENESGSWIKLCPVDLNNASITEMARDTTAIVGRLKPLGDVLNYVHPLKIDSHDAKTVWTAWACPTGKECKGRWLKLKIKDDEGVGNTFIFDPNDQKYVSGNLNAAAFVAQEPLNRLRNKEYSLPCN